ncbi:MAG: hypothetical protein IAF38_18890 [Bacteroidia bacterium]|nr:hypothetical protein [Bacteroidia bacterium]
MLKYLKTLNAILSLFVCPCISSAQTTQAQPKISWRYVENTYYKNTINPVSFPDSAFVYSAPDTTSKILEILKFKTQLHLIKEGEQQFAEKETGTVSFLKWYEIDFGLNKGYIKASEVATHMFSGINQADYLILTNVSKNYNPDGNGFTVYKFDRSKNQFTDTLKIASVRGDIIKEINYSGWKNTGMLLSVYMINAYCGGGTAEVFIIDANGKLSELITTNSHSDDGSADAYGSVVWLPVKTGNEKVRLVCNGDVETIYNTYSGELNTFPFPKELKLPKIELIVFKETEVKSILNMAGEPLLNKDGSFKSKKVKQVTKYFRWNGIKLEQIK